MSQIKIIYHQIKKGVNCPDGYAAAWVVRKVYPSAEIIGCWYQCEENDLPSFQSGDFAIIVDFSFPRDILQQWSNAGVDILLLDHHKTAMEHLGDISQFSDRFKGQVKFDMKECGATLAWNHFFPDKAVPLFLEYVKDRDLWNKALPYSDEIHEVISKLGRSFELYDLLEKYDDPLTNMMTLADLGNVLLAPKKRAISAIASRATESDFIDHENIPIIILNGDGSEDRLTSDICEELYTKCFPKAVFVACQTSDRTWSLRSNKNHSDGGFDVGALAKSKGGGGHRNAAGFKEEALS